MKQNELFLIVVGLVIGWVSLSLNQLFPYQYSIASLVSPTGAQVTLGGFRIKHWVVGIFLSGFAFLSYTTSPKKSLLKQAGLVILGSGIFLVVDEYEAVFRFVSTGAYP